MTNILAISASPKPAGSISNALIEHFLDTWKSAAPDAPREGAAVSVTRRDVGRTPPPHLDDVTIGAFYTPAEQLTAAQAALLALSDAVVDELEQADVIVIGAPMHNFSIPSGLKTWIDHAARVGRTFRYGADGPEGLLKGKRVFVLSARGGNYVEGTPAGALDHQMPYLKTVLGFIGLDDVTFIHAHGVAIGDDGIAEARFQIETIINAQDHRRAA